MIDGMEAGACSCDFDEFVEWHASKTRKARKEHCCDECHKIVKPGDLYVWTKWLGDEMWDEQKRCVQCQQIGVDFCCGVLGSGSVFERIWEDLGVNLRTGEVCDD